MSDKLNPGFAPGDSRTAPQNRFSTVPGLGVLGLSMLFWGEWRVTLSGDLWGWLERAWGDWVLFAGVW